MAFFGNALIILALRKLSSLHSPSKILISCLACTDLGVGLISNPLLNGYYLSPENSKSCHYFWALSYTATTILCGASLSTTTAISVDRLLALLLGLRYRQVVTVRRVMALVVTMWLSSILIAAVVYYSYLIALGMASAGLVLCIVISTFCYTKIYTRFAFLEHKCKTKAIKDNEMEKDRNWTKQGTKRQCPRQCGYKWHYWLVISHLV